MYLMGIVNATFVARRATDHVELVDLSVEKKEAQDRYNKEHKALTNGTATTRSPKPGGSPRLNHALLEAQPADLCMEPLFPLFLTSASSDSSSDGGDDTVTIPLSLEEASVNVVQAEKSEKTLEDASSRKLELEQESRKQTGQTTKTESKPRVTPPKLGRIQLSDGGVSTRVQRHPLEVIPEQEHSDEHNVVRAKIDRPARVLLHPLQRIDEDPTTKKERKKTGGVAMSPSPQPGGRKFVRESKPDEKQQPPKRERAKPRESKAPTGTKLARNPNPETDEVADDREKPSLASPVMEKMERLASPEPSWSQKFQNLPKLAVSNSEPLMEERELRYSSPKMTESDVQDEELSFRVWERECVPKRKSISVSSDFQDLDLQTCISANPESTKQQQLSPLRTTFFTPKPEAQEESIIHHDSYPSPSSIQCGLSPTSLFSDDDNMFSRFQQFPEFGQNSDSSETGHHRHHPMSSSTYNDESSDLESPNAEFSTFTYTDKEIELTTSEDENVDVSELRYFQEANRREPWLEKNGGVLDDTDLQFLLPLGTPQTQEDSNSEISEENPKDNWIPCDDTTTTTTTTTRSLPRRQHSRSSSKEKLHPPRRSVKFATDLVREISPTPNPNPKLLQLPRPESSLASPKDEDEHIYPSVESWEVKEEVDASRTPPPRRRWRTARTPKCEEEEGHIPGVLQDDVASPSIMSSRRRWRRCRDKVDVAVSRRHIMPCAGRLFSWPQRLSAFKVSRSRHRAELSDDESIAGTESFGRSARRDAQQVRRILKGSQKRFSNLTVADILTDSFQDGQPTPTEAAIHQGSESDTRTHN